MKRSNGIEVFSFSIEKAWKIVYENEGDPEFVVNLVVLSKGIDDAQSILGYVLSTKLSLHSILFSITCTSVTKGIMMNRRQL